MRKYNNVTPKRKFIKKAILSLSLKYWLKAIIACSRHDPEIKKEVEDWPEGFSVFFKVFNDIPYLGIRKSRGSLQLIASTVLFPEDILVSFKSPDIAYSVFSGRTGTRQALAERRFEITGRYNAGFSVIRAVMLSESFLRKSKFTLRCLAIPREILKIRIVRKEVSSHDAEVLRVS